MTRHNAPIAFLRKQTWCQWLRASPGRRSLLLMFGLGFRHMQQRLEYIWPQLRKTHRFHTERNFGQVRLAPAHAKWLGYQISRERSILSETNEFFFGVSAPQQTLAWSKCFFWGNSVHWQFLEKCAAFPSVQTSFLMV